MKKYLVQAILIDGNIETVVDSFRTDDIDKMLDFVMKRHRFSSKYLYVAMEIETQNIIVNTMKNKYS